MAIFRSGGIIKTISNIVKASKAKKGSKSSGTVFLKPSEATNKNLSAITSSGNIATVVSGSISNPASVSYISSGGSGGGYVQTNTPFQTQYQQEIQRQREKERKRQEEIKRIEDEKKRQQEIKRQAAIRAAENKRLQQLKIRANIEKKANLQKELLKDSSIKKQLELLKKRQTSKPIGLYIPETDKFGKSEAYYIQQQAEKDIKNHVNKVADMLQKKVNEGSLSVKRANELLTQEVDRKYDQIVKELERKYPSPEINYRLEVPARKQKEKFLDKAIKKLETLSETRREKAEKKKQELIKNREELEKLLGLVDSGQISDKDLARIQKISRRRIELTLSSFGTKAVSRVADTALGLALLGKVPGLLKTKEGRAVLLAQVKKLPANVKQDLKKFGQLYKTNPEQAAAIITMDFLLTKEAGTAFKKIGKISKETINKVKNLNPALLKIEKGIVRIKKPLPSGLITELKVGTIKEVKEGLATQLRREGKSLVAVTAQADKVIRGIRGRAIVRKPFPFDEKKLSKVTRDLLAKFDKGKASGKEVLVLNRLLRAETKRLGVQAKGVDLLERSMYFDPDRTLRKSRLAAGTERPPEEGTLFDLLTGEATLRNKTPKPTIYVIEEFAEKLPNTKEFATIIRKLKASVKAGKDPNLTKAELAKLTRWQVTPSGKLKPIGSTTYQGGLEREVTIAPGEVIKRVKKLGVLKVGNKRVPIYAIKIIKGKQKVNIIKRIEKLIKEISELRKRKSKVKTKKAKADVDKKLKAKVKELENVKTKKATKEVREFLRDTRRRKLTKSKKVFPARRKAAARAVTRTRKRTPTKRKTKRPTPRKRPSSRKPRPRKVTRPRKPTPRKPTPRKPTPRRPTPRRPTPKPPIRGTSKPPIIRKPKSKKKKPTPIKRGVRGYNVYVKSGGKFVKANQIPLSEINAQNRAAYIVDHSTSATAKIRPARTAKKLGKIMPQEVGARKKIKARDYKIVKGKKVPLLDTIIEKRGKPRINTRGEKRGLSAARLIKQLKKSKKRTSIKKKTSRKTSTKRKTLSREALRRQRLKNLEKARRVRAMKLRKRRK